MKKFGGLAKPLKRKKRREKQDTMERKRISSCVKKHEKQRREVEMVILEKSTSVHIHAVQSRVCVCVFVSSALSAREIKNKIVKSLSCPLDREGDEKLHFALRLDYFPFPRLVYSPYRPSWAILFSFHSLGFPLSLLQRAALWWYLNRLPRHTQPASNSFFYMLLAILSLRSHIFLYYFLRFSCALLW